MSQNTSYENRLVAFIDILGFSDLVKKSSEEQSILNNINNALNAILKIKERNDGGVDGDNAFFGTEVSTFSDSIVISYPLSTRSSLFYLLLDIIHMQMDLMAHGFLLRGGIAIGKLHHKGQICFGPAMNDAYFLESKVANYPRIIIEQKTIQEGVKKTYAEHNGIEIELTYINNLIQQDVDGVYYLDFMNQSGEIDWEGGEYVHWMKSIRPLIVNGLNDNKEDSRILIKYYWLMNYYNTSVLNTTAILPPNNVDIDMYIEAYKGLTITNTGNEFV